MGVLFGQIFFIDIANAYKYFKSYCLENHIGFSDEKDDEFLATKNISNLKVFDDDNTEIKGSAISVSGQGTNDFEITIEGVPNYILSSKFKHYIDHYKNLFDKYFNKDNIIEIGIDEKDRLYIKPEKATFPLIYRTATEVHWDEEGKFLYSPKPREWTYLDWYNQIISVLETDFNYRLKFTNKTIWTNISDDLKMQITRQ